MEGDDTVSDATTGEPERAERSGIVEPGQGLEAALGAAVAEEPMTTGAPTAADILIWFG